MGLRVEAANHTHAATPALPGFITRIVVQSASALYATQRSADGSMTGVLLRGSDGGGRWTRIALSTPLANIDFVSATLGFAEVGGGVVRTEVGGVTWRPAG